jgi:hypothetical protein
MENDITLSFVYKTCLEEEYMENGFTFRKIYINVDKYFSDDILNKNIINIFNILEKKIGNIHDLNKYKFEKIIFSKKLNLIANFDIIDYEKKKIYYIKINNTPINQKDIIHFYLNMIIIEFHNNKKEYYQYIIFNPVTLEEIHLTYNKEIANIIYEKILDELENEPDE